MRLEDLTSYEILEKRKIADLNSESVLLRHKKTGARVALLSNDDENKVFTIGFRTPPTNSTGVAHILEHSVLCGSRKFPLKDPFVQLVKGSLNTFLNAMTYPDKTIYPLASCNDKDFQNIMDVYLDAVFYPAISKEEKIFRQEGWHYEMQSPEDDLKINGVVYNEMKGAFSSPDSVFEREQMNSLFPDTTYGMESGGDPQVIPELSYEEFLQFHQKYYHPSNSYIYLYGNMDMAEKLDFIDKEYLSNFEMRKVDSEIPKQKAFAQTRRVVKEYPIGPDEDEKGNSYLSYNVVMEDSLDREMYIAGELLDYALCSKPGAPLKQALTDAGIGTEISSSYGNGIKQPFFSITAKNADVSQEKEFLDIIKSVLTDIAENGFDKKTLLSGLNFFEFKYREADFGSWPKGLMLVLQMFDSWLYDDAKPFVHVEANATYASLRKKVEEGYFEGLVKKYLLNNPHSSIVILEPKKGLTEAKDKELAEKLAAYKAGLSQAEIEKIVVQTKELKEYQEAPDSEEAIASIPLLAVSDIGKEARKTINAPGKLGDVDLLFHEIFTNGITYLRLIFNLNEVPERLFKYIPILKSVLGVLDTEHYKYSDLVDEIYLRTGNIAAVTNCYENYKDASKNTTTLEMKTKVMNDKLSAAMELLEEIMLTSNLADKKRLKEIIAESKSKMQSDMIAGGHAVACNRAMSYVSENAAIDDVLSGMELYRLLEHLDAHFEEEADKLIANLKELSTMVFRPENLLVDLTADKEILEKLAPLTEKLASHLHTETVEKGSFSPVLSKKNEGFKTASQVQYVCRAGNFMHKNLPYTGALQVIKVMLGYDYLWGNVRVKGGAYGCMCGFSRMGNSYFVSYRDPNLANTVEVYEKAADYLENFEADERTIVQFIIGAISNMDTPMNAAAKGLFSQSAYMTGLTDEDLQRERDEVLSIDAQTMRKMAEYVRAFMEDDCICVVGNSEKINECADMFTKTENLVG